MNEEVTEKTWKDWALRAIALIGLVAILVLGAWGIIQLTFDLPGTLDSIGGGISSIFEKAPTTTTTTTTPPAQSPAQEQLTVSAPSLITSAQSFTLSWAHQGGTGTYAYEISYACADGLSMKAPVPTGGVESVPCNTPFNFTDATQNITLTPSLSGDKQVATTFTVAAENLSNNSVVSSTGSAPATILPGLSATPATTKQTVSYKSTPSATYVSSQRTANLYGEPNLAASIISAVPTSNGYSVEFVIQNVGTNVAASGWRFNATIPTSGGYLYQSQAQRALYPGDKILYTLAFSAPQYNTYNNGQYPYNGQSYYPTYPTCGYTQNYTYNGYGNYPNGYSYNCSNTNNTTYPTYSYPSTYQYQNAYPYSTNGYSSETFTVVADPQGYLLESNRSDNTASVTL